MKRWASFCFNRPSPNLPETNRCLVPPYPPLTLKCSGFSRDELHQVVALHRREIGQGFLSSLGDTVLGLIFARAAAGASGSLIAAVDTATGRVCGFVCGAADLGAFYREFLQHHFFSGLFHLAPKLLSPARLGRALETLFYPTQKAVVALPPAELLIIAVDEAYQGQGIAQALFYELAEAFRHKGVTRFKVVAGANLSRTQRFYQKLGPSGVASLEVHRGQPSTVYIYDVADQLRPELSAEKHR